MTAKLTIAAAAWAAMGASAVASPITIQNGDFESAATILTSGVSNQDGGQGLWTIGADGWAVGGDGVAGTWAPNFDLLFPEAVSSGNSAYVGERIGFVNAGSSIYTSLGSISDGLSSVTADIIFGARSDNAPFNATVAFFAGSPANILQSFDVTTYDFADFELASFVADNISSALAGQTLGLAISNISGGQLTFDVYNISFSDLVDGNLNFAEQVVPLPGAMLFFGSGLVVISARRRRKTGDRQP